MKYLKYFSTEAEYNTYIQSDDFVLPNVSYAVDTDSIFYHIVKTETGDYKIFLLEKKNISGLTYNMVDLGLPSGRLWADRNVGASSPEDFGTYFAWGETSGYTASIKYCTAAEACVLLQPMIMAEITLTPDNIDEILSEMGFTDNDMTSTGTGFCADKCFSHDWSDYFDAIGNEYEYTFNKYAADKLTVLQSEDDAATVNMGSEYRMPTLVDFNELINNCTVTFIDLNGNEFSNSETNRGSIPDYNLRGIKFISSNGNSIFIPASGCCGDSTVTLANTNGWVWSSSLVSYDERGASILYFDYDININRNSSGSRWSGLTVRGVK